MNDNIDIPLEADPGPVERLISAIDRLHSGLEGLGNISGLTRLEQQMQVMQASMTTGFTEMRELVGKSSAEMVTTAEQAARQVLTINQRRDVELNRLRNQELVSYVSWWNQMLDITEKRETELHLARERAAQQRSQLQQKRDYDEWQAAQTAAQRLIEIQQKRDVELYTLQQAEAKRIAEIQQRRDYAEWQAAQTEAQRIIEIQQRRDVELHNLRQRDLADAAAAAERQRALNTTFLTANPASQLRIATEARTYAGLGGDATARYGSEAATANIAALRAAHEALTPAVNGSRSAVEAHNQAMNEAHSLARGLAGSLGGLWLTYGSLVPLAAGAAIAASLRQVVVVGADVEHQLTNVLAITNSGVNLDQFLKVSDGSLHSLVEGANAMRMLAQNGLNASESLQVLPAVLNLATAGEMTVAQAAIAATGAASAFGLGYSEAGRIADIFAKTAANSNTSVLAMTESMKQASTVASLFKVSIEETAAMLGLLAKINVTGGAAGTSLTNMLTGLYEPTEKGKKALKELGVETQLASGQLKPLTQLLDEMKGKLAGFNDAARVDILGSIFTVRGVKSAELALTNLDDFKKKTDEAAHASGFMADVVRKLEDDTTGGFQRLGVVVQDSFVRSFAEASPYVQHIALQLSDAFKDGGTASTGLQNFSTNVARLTSALVDNLGTVTLLGAGYVAMRALGPTIALIKEAAAASAALTVAEEAATIANAAHATAMSAGTATTATYTAMIEANTVATEAATAATAAWEATLLPILAAVGVAVGVAAAAWLLFRDNASEADKANEKIANSLHVVSDALERENKRLDENLKLWDAKNGRRLAPETVTQDAVEAARAQVAKLEAQARTLGQNPDDLRNSPGLGYDPGSGAITVSPYQALADALAVADDNLNKLLNTQKKFNEEVAPKQAVEKVQNATAQLREELDRFAKEGTAKDSKGNFYQQNAAVRAIDLQANDLRNQLLDPKLIQQSTEAEQARIDALRVDLKELQDERNALLAPRAPKEDHRAENDAYREALAKLDDELQQAQKKAQTATRDLQSAYQTGAISAVEAAQKEHDAQIASLNTAIEVAEKKKALAAGRDYGKADAARAEKDQNAARAGIAEVDAKLVRDYDGIIRKSADETTRYRIDQAKKEGDTALAYRLEHAVQIAQIDKGLDDSRRMLLEAAQEGDAKAMDRARQLLAGFEAAKRQSDEAIGNADQYDAITRSAQNFKAIYSGIRADLVQNQPVAGTGLSTIFDDALRAEERLAAALPNLQAAYEKSRALANKTGDPRAQKDANDQLAQIEAVGARMRAIWTGVGHSIEKALGDAFGKSGKAAGSLIDISVRYANTQKQIQATLARDSKGADPIKLADLQKKASSDMAAAQISAYGDMANAAKGFFNEQSGGYKILSTAERAFRMAELAMTVESMAAKLFATSTTTTAAVASTGPVVAAETAKSTAYGVTALAASLAAPFPANLVAFGVVAAMLAAIGVAMAGSGGSSKPLSEQRQEANGTGSVLGDSKAKSDSIAKSLDLIQKNTYQDLAISTSMLTALQGIQAGLTGLGSLVTQNLGQGTAFGNLQDSNKALAGSTGAMAGVGAAAGAKLGSYFGPWGTALGAVVGAVLGSLSRDKTTVTDQGILLNPGTLGDLTTKGVTGSSYADINNKKSFLGVTFSNSNSRQTAALSSELNQQFTLVFAGLRDTILTAADALGAGGDAFTAALDAVAVKVPEISTKGLTGEEIQKALGSALSKVGDDLAKAALSGLEQFQQVGEGYLETIARVATDYQTIDTVFASLGKTFGQVGLSSVAARERLIALSGGLDKFTSQSEFFLKNFLSETEQAAALQARIAPTLAQYGLSTGGVDANKMFADFVRGLDTTTEAGATAYSTLMALAPAFRSVTDALAQAAKDRAEIEIDILNLQGNAAAATAKQRQIELAAMDASLRPLKERYYALQDEMNAASQALDNVDGALSLLSRVVGREKDALARQHDAETKALQKRIDAEEKFVNEMQALAGELQSTLGSLNGQTPATAYDFQTALAQVQTAATIAKAGGPMPTADSLKGALTTLGKDASDSFGSAQAYERYLAQAKNSLNQLNGMTDTSVAQQTLDTLKAQKEAADAAYQAEIDRLDEIVRNAQAQADNLKGLPDTLMSVDQALKNLASVLALAGANPVVAATGDITKAYRDALGRAPDEAGMAYWKSRVAGGASSSDVVSEITNSSEAKLQGLYKSVLGRSADGAGLDYWLKQVNSGMSLESVRTQMMQSSEYLKTHQSGSSAINSAYLNVPASASTVPSNVATKSDMAALSATVAQQQQVLVNLTTSSAKTAELLDNISGGGGALLVEVVNQ